MNIGSFYNCITFVKKKNNVTISLVSCNTFKNLRISYLFVFICIIKKISSKKSIESSIEFLVTFLHTD